MASFYVLTPKEMEILLALFQSKNEKPSSAEMFMSEKLVELYLGYIRTVLGTRRRIDVHAAEQNAYVEYQLFHTGL